MKRRGSASFGMSCSPQRWLRLVLCGGLSRGEVCRFAGRASTTRRRFGDATLETACPVQSVATCVIHWPTRYRHCGDRENASAIERAHGGLKRTSCSTTPEDTTRTCRQVLRLAPAIHGHVAPSGRCVRGSQIVCATARPRGELRETGRKRCKPAWSRAFRTSRSPGVVGTGGCGRTLQRRPRARMADVRHARDVHQPETRKTSRSTLPQSGATTERMGQPIKPYAFPASSKLRRTA